MCTYIIVAFFSQRLFIGMLSDRYNELKGLMDFMFICVHRLFLNIICIYIIFRYLSTVVDEYIADGIEKISDALG